MRDFFIGNLPMKILSVIAASILWFFVMNDQNPATDVGFTVPVTVINSPGETRITKSDDSVRIKLRGPRSSFASFSQDELRAVADLSGVEPGDHPVEIKALIPHGFELLSVSPEMVTFSLDPIVQKRMPIQLVRIGQTPTGMAVAGIEPETRMVTIVGPETVIKSVSQVIGYLSIPNDATTDIRIDVSLTAVDEGGKAVERIGVVPREISVFVQFARGLSKKIVDVKPVFEGVIGEKYSVENVSVEPSRVEIAGSSQDVGAVSELLTEPVPLANITATTERTANLVLPEGVTVSNKQVSIKIEIAGK